MNRSLCYSFQAILFATGLVLSNITYADYNAAWIIVALAYMLELIACIWFVVTLRSRKAIPSEPVEQDKLA